MKSLYHLIFSGAAKRKKESLLGIWKSRKRIIFPSTSINLKTCGGLKTDKIFLDWGIIKSHTCVKNKSDKIVKLKDEKVKEIKDCGIFLEHGVPYLVIEGFLQNNNVVYICDPKKVKEIRGKREKDDEKDPLYIRELYDSDPNAFKIVDEKTKVDIKIQSEMRLYRYYCRRTAAFKNRLIAFKRQYGFESDAIKESIKIMERAKMDALKGLRYISKPYVEKMKANGLNGIDDASIMRLLTEGHPKDFQSLSKYLSYCGYKGSVKETKKFNREVKGTMYMISFNVGVRGLVPKFREFYEKCKQRFIDEGNSKGKANGRAVCRVSTFILKDIYNLFRDCEGWSGV